MVRAAALAVVAAVAVAVPAAAEIPRDKFVSWARALKPLGWTVSAVGSDTVVFTRPFEGKSTPKRIWVRYEEHPDAARDGRSSRSLQEIDCEDRRIRILDLTVFQLNNLEGVSSTGNVQPEWNYAGPGSIADGILTAGC